MHRNEKLIRDAYDAYGRNDIPGVTASWTEDTVWHLKGTTSLAGDYKGPEKILGLLADRAEGIKFVAASHAERPA